MSKPLKKIRQLMSDAFFIADEEGSRARTRIEDALEELDEYEGRPFMPCAMPEQVRKVVEEMERVDLDGEDNPDYYVPRWLAQLKEGWSE